jgi:hypothetical protein
MGAKEVSAVADEAPARLGSGARLSLAGFGLAALVAAVPVGFYCLILAGVLLGGWHGVTPRPVDRAAGLTLLAIPLLLLPLAGFSLACVDRRRLIVVASLAAALIADGALALGFLYLGSHGHRPPAGVTVYPDVESAEAARKGSPREPSANAVATGGPQTGSVACSPATGKCMSTTTKAR